MRHYASSQFWKRYYGLPERVQNLADECFKLLKDNPRHPSLHLKKSGGIWSARVGIHHRALAVEKGSDLVWYWLGNHSEYDKVIGIH